MKTSLCEDFSVSNRKFIQTFQIDTSRIIYKQKNRKWYKLKQCVMDY